MASNLGRLFSSVANRVSKTAELTLSAAGSGSVARSAACSAIRLFGSSTQQPPHEENPSKAQEGGVKDTESNREGTSSSESEEDGDGGDYVNKETGEVGGPRGPEPTRYGDWEQKGRCSDF